MRQVITILYGQGTKIVQSRGSHAGAQLLNFKMARKHPAARMVVANIRRGTSRDSVSCQASVRSFLPSGQALADVSLLRQRKRDRCGYSPFSRKASQEQQIPSLGRPEVWSTISPTLKTTPGRTTYDSTIENIPCQTAEIGCRREQRDRSTILWNGPQACRLYQ